MQIKTKILSTTNQNKSESEEKKGGGGGYVDSQFLSHLSFFLVLGLLSIASNSPSSQKQVK